MYAYSTAAVPSYPIPEHLIPPLPARTAFKSPDILHQAINGWHAIAKRNSPSIDNDDLPDLALDFHIFNKGIQEQFKLNDFDRDNRTISFQTCAIVLRFMSASSPSSVWGTQVSTARAFRLTALVYLDRIRRIAGEDHHGADTHFLEKLLPLILTDEGGMWADFEKSRIWMLVIAACFARTVEQQKQCIARLRQSMREQSLKTWAEVTTLCQNTIWSDLMLNDLCKQVGAMVMDEKIELVIALR